ncbi:Forkhead box P4 [Spraguea lophii 42_110]|uniref:Forkhead box P4 n=1 Tax=Spraguea lophii (strain 42_110) TaxID=1358809 RepID=S7W8Q9_SPRLO|nr:Forkhead box P4 [Spraguea lophii 42_110]
MISTSLYGIHIKIFPINLMPKNVRVVKNFTYQSIIKKAISEQPNQIATSHEIFQYITKMYPEIFKPSNSMTWKGNIRQLLSKSPQFVKISKTAGTKTNYWKYVSLEELEAIEVYKRDGNKYPGDIDEKRKNGKNIEENECLSKYGKKLNMNQFQVPVNNNYNIYFKENVKDVNNEHQEEESIRKYIGKDVNEYSDDYYEWLNEMDGMDNNIYPSFFDK